MASCVRNISTKNYQNLIIFPQFPIDNVRDPFWNTVFWRNCLQCNAWYIHHRYDEHQLTGENKKKRRCNDPKSERACAWERFTRIITWITTRRVLSVKRARSASNECTWRELVDRERRWLTTRDRQAGFPSWQNDVRGARCALAAGTNDSMLTQSLTRSLVILNH